MNTKSKSRSNAQSARGSAPTAKPKTKKPRTKYHGAARSLYDYFFAKYIRRKQLEVTSEHELSGNPRRIDILVIRKIRDVVIETSIGWIFRWINIVEYKSPVDGELTLQDFVKTVHIYAGGYAYKYNVKLTDMTATIVCHKKPVELFETLQKEFSYKISQKESGIYYIDLKGVPIEKALRIQIVVCPELSDEYWELDALSRELRPEELPKLADLKNTKEGRELLEDDWGSTIFDKNHEILIQEDKMLTKKNRIKLAKAWGLPLEEDVLKGRQEGMQRGVEKVLALLNVDPNKAAEVKRQLQLQPA